jgi:hypothetical protein
MAKIELSSLPATHPAKRVLDQVEQAGGTSAEKNYGGTELRIGGQALALMKNITGTSISFYLHHTTVEQAQQFCAENGLESLVPRLVLDKKGFAPARLTGITEADVDDTFLGWLVSIVEDGVRSKLGRRAAQRKAAKADEKKSE